MVFQWIENTSGIVITSRVSTVWCSKYCIHCWYQVWEGSCEVIWDNIEAEACLSLATEFPGRGQIWNWFVGQPWISFFILRATWHNRSAFQLCYSGQLCLPFSLWFSSPLLSYDPVWSSILDSGLARVSFIFQSSQLVGLRWEMEKNKWSQRSPPCLLLVQSSMRATLSTFFSPPTRKSLFPSSANAKFSGPLLSVTTAQHALGWWCHTHPILWSPLQTRASTRSSGKSCPLSFVLHYYVVFANIGFAVLLDISVGNATGNTAFICALCERKICV